MSDITKYKHANHRYVTFDGVKPKDTVSTDEFCDNYVSTTKYTILSFLPKNLFEQFKKKANFYFLIIAILSCTSVSPKRPEVSILPLVFVLTVSAAKEAIEDYARFQMDKDVNNSPVQRFLPSIQRFEFCQWQQVQVGDIVRIHDDGAFPADLMLLQSASHQGMCTIETSNLDGETNLKIKKAVAATWQLETDEEQTKYCAALNINLISSLPNEKMDVSSWTGNLDHFNGRTDAVPVGMTQMLLRGCTLRNTKWVLGLVVFTGVQTKLMLNNKSSTFKRSNVERTVDSALYVIFFIQGSLCILGFICNWIWLSRNSSTNAYLMYDADDDIALEAFFSFFTYIVLLDLLVPISLYVSMELVKFTQAYLINQDLSMYDKVTDTPARARTSNLNEELGQITFIFSDKTGTLTQNKMEFLRCSIGGVLYSPDETDSMSDQINLQTSPLFPNMPPVDPSFRFRNKILSQQTLYDTTAPNHELAREFVLLLAVCHTVITETVPETTKASSSCDIPLVEYQAASPDERALVIAAKNLGCYFTKREAATIQVGAETIDGQTCRVIAFGEDVVFEILAILEFNSTRKRMSVIVRDPRTQRITLWCKGADNVIVERMSSHNVSQQWTIAEQHLTEFARDGLRTLCCASRYLSEDEFLTWYDDLKIARAAIEERDHKVTEVSERIEQSLSLVGCTAIEDRLQDGVPLAIATLSQASIKIWVLTGDKVETAINIGRSARLITEQMRDEKLIIIDIDETLSEEKSIELTRIELDAAWEQAHRQDKLKNINVCENDNDSGLDVIAHQDLALVINGKALGCMFPVRKRDAKGKELAPSKEQAATENLLQQKLLKTCRRCAAVICCRVSPKQKSQVVLLVRRNVKDSITLAIGDGANDVSMIKAAHVGVGISGQEGLQAVMASDYSIAQFNFLTQLLLVHGAWSYRRISALINYSFYKNIAISVCQFLFAIYNGFSAQVFFDAYTGSLFNMWFTAAPICLLAVLNRDVSAKVCHTFPKLYCSGQTNDSFNIPLLMRWIIKGVFHALVLFFVGIWTLSAVPLSVDGLVGGLWQTSTSVYMALLLVVTSVVSLLTTTWTIPSVFFLGGSFVLWFAWIFIYTSTSITPDMYGVASDVFGIGLVWLMLPVVVAVCVLPEIGVRHVLNSVKPTLLRVIQERENRRQNVATEVLPVHAPSIVSTPMKGITSDNESSHCKERMEELSPDLNRRASSSLGFVPFQENENADDFVMGQDMYLKNSLASNPSSPAS